MRLEATTASSVPRTHYPWGSASGLRGGPTIS
nr:MAG TPA: hypothetical protein [Caudoviricetes sp.]